MYYAPPERSRAATPAARPPSPAQDSTSEDVQRVALILQLKYTNADENPSALDAAISAEEVPH